MQGQDFKRYVAHGSFSTGRPLIFLRELWPNKRPLVLDLELLYGNSSDGALCVHSRWGGA